jgi:cyclophilin family peptidyl-prolyl cis-trans isomerase
MKRERASMETSRTRTLRLLFLLLATTAGAQTRTTPRHAVPPVVPKPIEATGPIAIIDTSAGRFTCRLYVQQAPVTVANFIALAEGSKDWTDASGTVQHGKPFYDALQVFGMSDGVVSGDRAALNLGSGEPDLTPEKTGLDFDRAGRLAALTTNGKQSSSGFAITDHPDREWARRGIVFGQCDEASVELSAKLTHELLSTDNHPEHPVVLRSVRIVTSGQSLPPDAAPIPGEADLRVPPPAAPIIAAPEPAGPTVTIETTMGSMTCRLFNKEAPIGAANFIGLATGTKPYKNPATHGEVRGRHFYDGLTFGRVIPDFMIQNVDSPGDPEGGGAGYKFSNEIAPGLSFDRPGRLAYANSGPDTNSSEFFITEHAIRRLDGNYTIFGQCDEASIPVVDAIANTPRDDKNHPLKPVTIKRITVTAASPRELQ